MRSPDPLPSCPPAGLFDHDRPSRVVVISPHLDDAVMSLGATIAQAAQTGIALEILTVFAGDPASPAPADAWDRRSGFKTEGDAANARREEDSAACSRLRATPVWLGFGAEAYNRHGTQDDIGAAVSEATRDADCVLLPGYPLVHSDHAELTHLLLRRGLGCRRVGLYAEQPYAFYRRHSSPQSMKTPDSLRPVLHSQPRWLRLGADRSDRRAKLLAVADYRSQLRQLGLGGLGRHRMLWHESWHGGEAVAWLPPAG